MAEPEYLVDFPTLGDLDDAWLEQHARIPDGFDRGAPFAEADWQFWCLANHYRVREDAEWIPKRPLLNQAFVNRRSLIVGPQKLGKGPWSAGISALEAVGPVVFGGWAAKGDGYACSDFGCGCGWEYEYEPGEPMGIRHPSPLIQLTALSEDQVANVYRPLRAMISLGPLSDLLAVRGDHIKILGMSDDPELDRIDQVTSSANSRVGNPISFALQDESGLATKQNKMVDVYEAQRRGAAGMGGRTMETTNAWDPAQNSVAQRTYEAKSEDVFVFWRQPPANLSYRNKRERAQIHRYVYFGSPWVNIDSIEAESAELMKLDAAQGERFFGNRAVAGTGTWLAPSDVPAKITTIKVAPRTKVALGFDGSDNDDFTGIRLETLDFHQFTPTYGEDRKRTFWKPGDWSGRIPRDEVRAAVAELVNEFDIVRGYLDPFMWETEIDEWAGMYGEKKFVKWATNRILPMHAALERFRTDLRGGPLTVDDHDEFRLAANNAVMRSRQLDPLTGRRVYILGKPAEHRKIDLAMSGVLAHEAAADAVGGGENKATEPTKVLILR